MLKIRLQRIGKRGQAYFRVVVTEHTKKPKGKYLELLGSYDPHKNEIKVAGEKIKDWIIKGAKMSDTVNNLLVDRKIIEGEKVPVWKAKSRRSGEIGTPKPTLSVGSPTGASSAETSGEKPEDSKPREAAPAGVSAEKESEIKEEVPASAAT